ncbi:MAG TPA: hypothetical protein VLF66_20790 [Thermoanaerobaculia bacterium]|nr:hypothetical protein [Thermoanaerobaculia bacterium]
MRYRWLTAFPLLYAAAFAAVAWALLGSDALDPFVRGQLLLVRVLAIVGCFAAVSAFERGDHLRRAWLWLGVATVLILARDVWRLAVDEATLADPVGVGLTGLWLLSNVALLTGVWLLARSWRVAAIDLPGGRGGVITVTVIAAVLALAVAGPFAWRYAQAVMGGDWAALPSLVSAVVDILALCLLAPLFLTAMGLRGGLFAWPWALITASMFSWVLYDAAAGLAPTLDLRGFPLTDVFRGLAQNFVFAAGLAQRFAVTRVRQARG